MAFKLATGKTAESPFDEGLVKGARLKIAKMLG